MNELLTLVTKLVQPNVNDLTEWKSNYNKVMSHLLDI